MSTKLGSDTCVVMHLEYNNYCINYDLEKTQLHKLTGEKDLGVIISEDLK